MQWFQSTGKFKMDIMMCHVCTRPICRANKGTRKCTHTVNTPDDGVLLCCALCLPLIMMQEDNIER